MIFKLTCLCCIFESTSAIFVWQALRNFAIADFEENVEEMVGTTREVAGTRPGTRPEVPGTRPATRWRRQLVTNETAATGGVMYADEGPYTIDVRHLCLVSIGKFCDGGL